MEGASYLLFCFNHFKLQNLCGATKCHTGHICMANSSSKGVLPPSQGSVVESDIFVEMKSRCTKAGKQCFSAMFSCKQVSCCFEQVSVNLGLCAIGIFRAWSVSKES